LSQDLYMLIRGVYGSAKEYIQVVERLYIVGGKIFYGGEKLFCSPFSIALRFQLIIMDRAKILQGVGIFILNHMLENICMGKKSVISSRKVLYSWVDILQG